MPTLTMPNGSFEDDVDGDGVPDGWERGLYPGGEGGFDASDSAHGARSYRFVHPGGAGNGGGYLESGLLPANPLFFPPVRFAVKASAPGVKAACAIRCHDRHGAFLGERELFASTANPTAWGLVVVTNLSGLPSGTEFVKVRLIGGKDDGEAAGTVWFDAAGIEGVPASTPLAETLALAETGTRAAGYIDVGEPWEVTIPPAGKVSWLVVGVELKGYSWSDEMSHGSCRPKARFRIGDRFSTEVSGPARKEWGGPYFPAMNIEGLSGKRQLRFQLREEPGGEGSVRLRSPASLPRGFYPNTRIVDVASGTFSDGWRGVA